MKKILFFAAALFSASSAFAGGYLTNTNQSVSFVRNPARLATFELDGAYSNPAGLAWIGEGLHISFNWQAAVQERNIKSTFGANGVNPFGYNVNQLKNKTRFYKGEAKAPIIPSLQAAYQKGKWTASLHAGVIGGGGKCTYEEGLPMFEAPVSMIVPAFSRLAQNSSDLANFGMPAVSPAKSYSTDMKLEGAQYIYGVQAGVTYKIFDNLGSAKQGLSVYLGARASIVRNQYEGYMKNVQVHDAVTGKAYSPTATLAAGYSALAAAAKYADGEAVKYEQQGNAAQAADQVDAAAAAFAGAQQCATAAQEYAAQATQVGTLAYVSQGIELDCEQSGWGIAPIIGLDYRVGKLNIGARYEFKTNVLLENDTDMDDIKGEKFLAPYLDGVKTDNDIPAILAIGAQYDIFKNWRVMAGWNMYFDKDAEMSGGKEAYLDHNTMEFQFGTEYDIKNWTISLGYQNTNYGMLDGFQSDLAFSCDSHMLNVGLRYKINKHFTLDAGYMRSFYDDYTKVHTNYNSTGLPGTDVYSRENQVIGVGVTWHM